jgi:hypothetical protein
MDRRKFLKALGGAALAGIAVRVSAFVDKPVPLPPEAGGGFLIPPEMEKEILAECDGIPTPESIPAVTRSDFGPSPVRVAREILDDSVLDLQPWIRRPWGIP